MTDRDETEQTEPGVRARPDGSAWSEAQRRVASRNNEARKAAKAQRIEYEQRLAAERARRRRDS